MFLAKIASDFNKPNGLSLLLPEEPPGRLFVLKLTDLTGIAKARPHTRFRLRTAPSPVCL
jgi:DNA polymerase-4